MTPKQEKAEREAFDKATADCILTLSNWGYWHRRAELAYADRAVLTEALRQAAKDLRELAALLGDEGYFLRSKEIEMKVAAIDKLLEGGK